MSAYMQIDVRVLPVFGAGGLKSAFPHLFKLLKDFRYDLVIQKEPSLYDIVEVLQRIKNDPQVPVNSKRPIIEKLDGFLRLRDQARELLLARSLNDLDRVLYKLEDLYEQLERDLS
ncbi:MAG: hypothetical protein AB9866_02825 [Syntrophobacteraceae bacterium]